MIVHDFCITIFYLHKIKYTSVSILPIRIHLMSLFVLEKIGVCYIRR